MPTATSATNATPAGRTTTPAVPFGDRYLNMKFNREFPRIAETPDISVS